MPDPKNDPLALATRYSDRQAEAGPARQSFPGDEPQTTYRAQNLPYAEYSDGSYRLGTTYPQTAADAWHSLQKFGHAVKSMFGAKYAPQDAIPSQEDAILATLPMVGSGFGSLARRAISGPRAAQVEASHGLPSNAVEAGKLGLEPFPSSSPFAGKFFHITRDGEPIGRAAVNVNGNKAEVVTIDVDGGPNALGVSGVKDLREAFRQHFPDVTDFSGWRNSGARNGPAALPNDGMQKVTLFSNPKEAAPLGLIAGQSKPQTIRAYHGTNESFDMFDPSKTKEVGFHFGSKEAADARSVAKNGPLAMPWPLGKGWRTIPVDIEANKIADLSHDPAGFGGYVLAKQLVEDGIAPPEVLKEATRLHVRDYASKDLSASRDYVRNWLTSNGYDVVRYPNTYEGGGHSYMTMGTGNVRHAKSGATLFSNPKEAAPVGMVASAYRGAAKPEEWPPTQNQNNTFWASSDPSVAENYAGNYRAVSDLESIDPGAINIRADRSNIMPAEMRFQNPLVVDAQGRTWKNIPWPGRGLHDSITTDHLAELARQRGHDGVVVRNIIDDAPPATTYAALKPGTVFSPLTGEQLFSNPPQAAAAGTVGMSRDDRPMYASGGTPPYPGDDFPSMLANNPHGWGNAPPIPVSIQDKEPWNFPGEARNLPDRPSDPVETPLAESLSPTMGAYGAGQLFGESLNRFAQGDLKGSAETALPLLLGIFAGPGARTADMSMLAKAKELAAAKAPREQIWGDTGWFQGADQKWRFEIDDNASRYNRLPGTSARAENTLEHPELYRAYENIGLTPMDVKFPSEGPFGGQYYSEPREGIKVQAPDTEAAREIALHELQHAIQQREGFAPGSNADAFTPDVLRQGAIQEYDAKINALKQSGAPPSQLEELTRKRGEVSTKTDDFWRKVALSMYRATAGEVESRNVQTRMNMTPEQRRATPPWETQDVPDIDQIVRSPMSGGVQMSVTPKRVPYPGDEPPPLRVDESQGDGGVRRFEIYHGDMPVGTARMMGDTLGDIEVRPELRRLGYGTQIVREMIERGAKNWNAVTPESKAMFDKFGSDNPSAPAEAKVPSQPSVPVESGSAPEGFSPDVWYHGTSHADEIRSSGFKPGWTHLSSSKPVADSYQDWARGGTSPDTLEANLKLQNPAYYDAKGQKYTDVAHRIYYAADDARRAGHDGFIINNVRDHSDSSVPIEPHTSAIVFDPTGRIHVRNRAPFPGDVPTPSPVGAGSDAARLMRAREQGFDPDTTVYRGLNSPYSEEKAAKQYYQMFTHSPEDASAYTEWGDKPNVVAAYLRRGNNLAVDAGQNNFNSIPTKTLPEAIRRRLGPVARTDEIAHAAREAGYDSLTVHDVFDNPSNERRGKPTTIEAVFDPKNVRSKFANFDLDKSNENGLNHAYGGSVRR